MASSSEKTVLLIKEFSGLADTLLPIIDDDQGEAWSALIIEDWSSASEPSLSHDALVTECIRLCRSENPDLVLFEDPQSGCSDNVEWLMSHESGDSSMPGGGFNFGVEPKRLEMCRSYGKDVCKRLGIPFVPVVSTFNLLDLKPGSLDDIRQTLEAKNLDHVYAKFDCGPSICGGNLDDVFSRLSVTKIPHSSLDHREDEPEICQDCQDDELSPERRKQMGELLEKRQRDKCQISLEPLISMSDRTVEFSVCMLANGKTAIPVCTLMDLENRLFHGKQGSKISDVSQIIVAGVHERWQKSIVEPMGRWVAESHYVGWFDVDLVFDFESNTFHCFEFMVRFSIPSISCVLKLGCCNWLDVFAKMTRGESVEQKDFQWKAPWSVGVGMFTFSTEPNCVNGEIPTGAPVLNYEQFWRKHPRESNEHVIGIEVFDCPECKCLELAGHAGRHLYAVGTGLTWREALNRAYNVCRTISYPNKIFKINLFGIESPNMADSDLDALLPNLQSIMILPK